MIFTVFKLVHSENVPPSIDVTPFGIVMDVNDSHPENAYISIDITDDGRIIDVRLLQPEKAYFPIDVRLDVIFTADKFLHS